MIRIARPSDTVDLLAVERAAFGGPDEADLVEALLADRSALPVINLVAEKYGDLIGHALFTNVAVEGAPSVTATILAPLAVAPGAQGRGVGQALCREGIRIAREMNIGLVFVLGHPGYYPRVGFTPSSPLGLDPPYAIALPDAWMVHETRPGLLGDLRGVARCADALMHPEMWHE